MKFAYKIKNTTFIVFILLSLLVIQPSFAEDDPVTLNSDEVQKLDLKEALGIALEKNRLLLQEKMDDKVYKFQLKQEFTEFLPTLQVTNDFQYTSNVKKITLPGVAGSFSSAEQNQNTTMINAIQPIVDLYSTSLSYRIAKANYEIAKLNTEVQREATLNDVSGFYFDIIKQKRTIDLTKENINRLKGYYDVAYNKYTEGDALSRDYMKIQIEIDQSQHDLLIQENKLDLLTLQFKNALGISLLQSIEVVETFEEEELENQSLEEMEQIALQNRPEVKQVYKNLHIAKLNKRLRYAEYLPEANFFVSYGHYVNSGFAAPDTVLLGVNVTYDFWKWGKKFWGVKEKGAEYQKAYLQMEDLKDQIYLQVKSQLNTVIEASDLIDVSSNNVKLAKESLRITTNRYKEGLALILDLLDDQNNYLESQVNLVSSELDYQKNLVELKKTLGILDYME